MLCPVCCGSGSILSTAHGLEWWPCPCCGTAGVRIQHGARFIGPGTRRKDKPHG